MWLTFCGVDKYKVTWDVSDGGTITGSPLTVLDGDPPKASLKPYKGFPVEWVVLAAAVIIIKKKKHGKPGPEPGR